MNITPKRAGCGFLIWFSFVAILSVASLVGMGYAVYWGLSIAQEAVENSHSCH